MNSTTNHNAANSGNIFSVPGAGPTIPQKAAAHLGQVCIELETAVNTPIAKVISNELRAQIFTVEHIAVSGSRKCGPRQRTIEPTTIEPFTSRKEPPQVAISRRLEYCCRLLQIANTQASRTMCEYLAPYCVEIEGLKVPAPLRMEVM